MKARAMKNLLIAQRAALKTMRKAYVAEVERLAVSLRSRFESGELHGYDFALTEDELKQENEQSNNATFPAMVVENEVEAQIPDFPSAYLILACSPEEENIDGSITLQGAKSAAAECMAVDAFHLARVRGWWRPRSGEWIGGAEWEAIQKTKKATGSAA